MAPPPTPPTKKKEVIAGVSSGEMTIAQASIRYGIPEATVEKWVRTASQGSSAGQPRKVTISLDKKTELIARVTSGELSTQQAAAVYGVPESFIDKWVPVKPKTGTMPKPPTVQGIPKTGTMPKPPAVPATSKQSGKVAISLQKKTELIARVTSGDLSTQQAAAAYGIPESIIDKWVPVKPKTGSMPAPPTVQSSPTKSTVRATVKQPKKVAISMNARDELIARVVAGELSSQQAATAYGIPENFIEKWVASAPQREKPVLIPLSETVIIGRDTQTCQHVLRGAHVSPQHTQIECVGDQYFVTNLSQQGTYLNGAPIQGAVQLQATDILNIGPYRLLFDGSTVITETSAAKAEIICSKLSKKVTDRSTGEKIFILNDVSLLFQPCEFTVIIGPSGGGKSTLLNALCGRNPATSGDVLVNGQNLYTHFDALKQHMALVPQKDALHGGLRLRKALLYTARLRLPPDLEISAYDSIVDEYLETVSLNDRTETLIKHLSGGQVKRASLANEIISQPNLLFVDEATSGLDEHTDGEIMKIFREIAEGGKTVVCITHNLNNVEKYCHNVIILANGGYLVFCGNVADAKTYFNVDRLGDVYGRLLDKPGTEWKDDFSRTAAYREMDAQVKLQTGHLTNDVVERKPQSLSQKTGVFLRQLPLLSRRGWEIQLSDVRSMAVVGLQCVFVALLMCIGFGELPDELPARALKARQIIFLLTLSSFWFGCNNAAKDIVKEKDIYERERDVCLNVGSYYTAKFLMLATITTLQVLFLLLAVNWRTNLPGSFAAQALSIGLIGICGVSTGLFISAISKNTDMAVTLIPVAIIPQVILAGVIFDIEGGFTEVLSSVFISCYWGQGNMMSTLPDQLTAGTSFEPWTYLSVGLIAFHTALLIIMANAVLYAADKRLSLHGTAIDLWLKKQG